VSAFGSTVNPFAVLGTAPSFDVDLVSLERTHRELSRAFHPDRYVGAGSSERREALTRAIEVNEAWRIVRDPIHRAEALLALGGVAVSEEGQPRPTPEFLMEMLEQRESLSEARDSKDRGALQSLAKAIRARSLGAERELSRGFASGASGELVSKLGELRFYRRFLDEVSVIEDEL
jgi:molecular chaperone HscB